MLSVFFTLQNVQYNLSSKNPSVTLVQNNDNIAKFKACLSPWSKCSWRLSTQGIRWGCAHAKTTRLLLMSISRINISIRSHSVCMSSSSCTCEHCGVRCNACRCQCHCQLASTPMISKYQICHKNHSNEFFRNFYAVSPERILCRIQLKNPFQDLCGQFFLIR